MRVKDWWPLIAVIILWLVVIAFLAGIAMATSPAPDAPFGLLEFWINRYQTLIATGFAIFTIAIGLIDVSTARIASRKQGMLTVRRELEACKVCDELAVSSKKSLESGEVPTPITSVMTELVKMYGSPRLSGIFEQHAKVVAAYVDRPELRETLSATLLNSADLVVAAAEYERSGLLKIIQLND